MPVPILIILRILAFIAGLGLVAAAVGSAVKTFVLPRSAPDVIVGIVFRNLRKLFELFMRPARTYEQRDAIMAFFAPTGLMVLLPAWLVLIREIRGQILLISVYQRKSEFWLIATSYLLNVSLCQVK